MAGTVDSRPSIESTAIDRPLPALLSGPSSKHLSPSDAEKQASGEPDLTLSRSNALTEAPTHVSAHDIAALDHYETGDEIYSRFSPRRKTVIVTILAFCSLLAPISSTSVLSAVPEVAETYSTTGTVINISNALYQVFMGLSPMLFGPLGQTYGRRPTQLIAAVMFTAFSIATALAPNLASFFAFRILTAFAGTSFLIIGSSCIGDIYKPTERATALSWFLSGTLIGPALGPFLGGVIVTFRPWTVIFWLQAAISGACTVMVFFFLPETIHYKKSAELEGLSRRQKTKKLWSWMSPWRVLRLYRYPNLTLTCLAAAALVFNMYSVLSAVRYVLNPRFNLTSPLQSGLFYIAPGCGYLVGTFFGGRWADHTVKKWIIKRNGLRVPEDRLNSCLIALGVVIPGCMLIYGWSIEKRVGGIPLPVAVLFLQGVGQLLCFPSLNTYCLDVIKDRSAEVIALSYCSRYFFGCIGSAIVLPFIERYGVGWYSTFSAALLAVSALGVWAVAVRGPDWRESMMKKDRQRKDAAGNHGP